MAEQVDVEKVLAEAVGTADLMEYEGWHGEVCVRDLIAAVEQLQKRCAQLEGEEPIPESWWADCPKLAQKTMERLQTSLNLSAERVGMLTARCERLEQALEGALNIKELWLLNPDCDDHACECMALQSMLTSFQDALQGPEKEKP